MDMGDIEAAVAKALRKALAAEANRAGQRRHHRPSRRIGTRHHGVGGGRGA